MRQMGFALNGLSSVDKNVQEKVENPVLRKICNSTEEKIRQKKRELFDDEHKLAELEMPMCEPAPQGSMHYRCTNCYVRGHKADNNKGNSVCRNDKCTDYRSCGQNDKHKEYRDDKKKIQNRLKNIKNEIADLEDELVRATAYEAKSGNSFTKVVKDRLRKSNPTKYSQSSVLLRDVMALKTAYDNKIPTVSQNDKLEFQKKIKEVNTKIKKEYDSDSSITDSPPSKKNVYRHSAESQTDSKATNALFRSCL
ncbi:unnamed protein product [Mytilus coruscus]|uniref:Uncharacterized protein n=1 Tax=Mytilus coruscus TaxID=42192 RepID=A0A6J8ER99_MYTCO|nr:unnamed protein product [Mytilus coruscus]